MKLLADTSNWVKGRKIQQSEDTRYTPKLNGVSQYYKLAKTVVGDGAGTITLRGKLSDIDETVKLLDGASATNRLYLNLNDTNDSLFSPSLTVTVNNLDSIATYNELIEIVISGDLTGLELATVAARFDGTQCAKFQPFYIAYEDQSQSFEYDFTKSISDYILPEGFEPLRNIVTANKIITLDGSEADYYTIGSGIGDLSGSSVVYTVTISNYTSGKLKLNTDTTDSPWFGGKGVFTGVMADPSLYLTLQSSAGAEKFIGTAELDVRIIPNALILQGASANIADDFEEMVQRGDGHWLGLKNYFGPSNLNVTWSQEGKVFTKNSNAWGGMGELPSYDTVEPGDWYVSYTASAPNLSVFTKNAENTANNAYAIPSGKNVIEVNVPTAGLWFDSTTASGVSLSQVKFNKLFKLSDYLLNRYQKEQTEAAIAAYESKRKSRYIVQSDGVNDFITHEAITLTGGFTRTCKFQTKVIGDYHRLWTSADGNARLYMIASGIVALRVYDGVTASYMNSTSAIVPEVNLGTVHEVSVTRDENNVWSGTLDGQPFNSEQILDIGNVVFDNIWASDNDSHIWEGMALGQSVIDHVNPLPLGQGGQSVFWAMDDEPGAIVENKLGLDKKGNIVAKDGAGLGPELMVDLSSPGYLHPNLTSSYENGVLTVTDLVGGSAYPAIRFLNRIEDGEVYLLTGTIDSSGMADRHGFIGVGDNSDTSTERLVGESGVTSTKTMIAYPEGDDNLSFYLDDNSTVAGDFVRFSNLSLRKIYGNAFGIWQGLPADFSTTKLHVTEGDGSKLAPAVLAFPANSNLGTALPNGAALMSGNTLTRHQASFSYRGLSLFSNSDSNKRVVFSGEVIVQEGVYVPIRIQGAYPDRIDGCFNLETGEWSTQPSVREGFPAEIVAMSVALTNAGTVVFSVEANIDSTVANVVMYITAAAANGAIDSTYVESDTYIEIVDLLISHQERLTLSAELQRQHDLAIVEKQKAQQLKKAEKSMVLAELDGVDDYGTFPDAVLNADFEIEIPILPAPVLSWDCCVFGQDFSFRRRGDNGEIQVYYSNGSGPIAFDSGITDIEELSVLTFGALKGELYFKYEGVKVASKVDDLARPLVLKQIGKSNGGQPVLPLGSDYFSGYMGYISITDFAAPLASRFYVHNPAGYLEDLLHPDGSMDGVYSGMPANFSNIQKVKKKVDDWYGVELVSRDVSDWSVLNAEVTFIGNKIRVTNTTNDRGSVYLSLDVKDDTGLFSLGDKITGEGEVWVSNPYNGVAPNTVEEHLFTDTGRIWIRCNSYVAGDYVEFDVPSLKQIIKGA